MEVQYASSRLQVTKNDTTRQNMVNLRNPTSLSCVSNGSGHSWEPINSAFGNIFNCYASEFKME